MLAYPSRNKESWTKPVPAVRIFKYGVLFQAEKCIREQLAVRETATLWNLLGDATMVRTFCEKPLELKVKKFTSSPSLSLLSRLSYNLS